MIMSTALIWPGDPESYENSVTHCVLLMPGQNTFPPPERSNTSVWPPGWPSENNGSRQIWSQPKKLSCSKKFGSKTG